MDDQAHPPLFIHVASLCREIGQGTIGMSSRAGAVLLNGAQAPKTVRRRVSRGLAYVSGDWALDIQPPAPQAREMSAWRTQELGGLPTAAAIIIVLAGGFAAGALVNGVLIGI
jgi:CHASE1-domain containing sensor protein